MVKAFFVLWQGPKGVRKWRIAERSEFVRCKKLRACMKNLMQSLGLFGAPKPESNRHVLTNGGF